MAMPPMLAYSIQTDPPLVRVGLGTDMAHIRPDNPQQNSYWIAFLSAQNPKQKVKEWVIPASQNSTVPAGIENFMNNPAYIFALATQGLATMQLPQGDFYNFLVKYGAGPKLQRMEQRIQMMGCGAFGATRYVLTGNCGPRGPGSIGYEAGYDDDGFLLMSLMPMPNGQPPYGICNSYTFKH
jgi:hypothetical protein